MLALGAAGCLYGMDAVRALKKQSPLNLLPAIGWRALCICHGTPISFVSNAEQLVDSPMWRCLLAVRSSNLRTCWGQRGGQMRWEGKAAFKSRGLMLLCYVPAGLCAAADAAMDLPGRVQIAPLFAQRGGGAGWCCGAKPRGGDRAAVHRRGRNRGVLPCAGSFFHRRIRKRGAFAARVINGFFSKACLSAYGFCVSAG